MKIERVRIQGYRSLHDVQFVPRPLSVLVGPNNGGKSNLVDAFAFLADMYGRRLKSAIDARGGLEAFGWRQDTNPTSEVSFDVTASFPVSSLADEQPKRSANGRRRRAVHAATTDEFVLCHAFTLNGQRQGNVIQHRLVAETLEISLRSAGSEQTLLCGRMNPEQTDFWIDLHSFPRPEIMRPVGTEGDDVYFSTHILAMPDQLALDLVRSSSRLVDAYMEGMASIRTYAPIPAAGRLPGAAVANGELTPAGEGLPSVVSFLQSTHKDAWHKVLEAMSAVVPTLSAIRVEKSFDGSLALRFVEEGRKRAWSAAEISDGTIRALALFVGLYDPRHRLVIIDEPEDALHPWAIRAVIDACRGASGVTGDKQVILATHSPIVLDFVVPEDISIVWRWDERTRLRPLTELDPDASRLWAEGKGFISGLLDSGWIREGVPLGAP